MTPSDAHACSEFDDGAYQQPCVSLDLRTPAGSFPMNVVDQIRLERLDVVDGGRVEAAGDFPLAETIEVAIESPDGYIPVAFELFEDPDGGANARRLSLVDPQPGQYFVGWEGQTCSGAESPTGSGFVGRGFTVGAELAVPATLGTLTAKPPKIVEDSYGSGVGGDCEPETTVHRVLAQAPIDLSLDSDIIPWAEVVYLDVRVNGESYPALGNTTASTIASGVVPFSIEYVCSTDSGSVGQQLLTQGTHQVTVRATLADGTELETKAVSATLDCQGTDEEGGCSVATLGSGSRGHAPWAFVAAAAMMVAYRRRRSSRG